MRFPDLTWAVRLGWLGVGLMWFVWLGVEDRGVLVVLLMGTAVCLSAGLTGLDRWGSGDHLSERQWWNRWLLMGLVSGAGIGPLALMLMAIKVSLHSHGIPDFNRSSVDQVLETWPVWWAGTVLISLALGAIARAKDGQPDA